jgi:hypothetical protein
MAKDKDITWEYESQTTVADQLSDVLNREGRRGWEAWHLERNPDGSVGLYFKRHNQGS